MLQIAIGNLQKLIKPLEEETLKDVMISGTDSFLEGSTDKPKIISIKFLLTVW